MICIGGHNQLGNVLHTVLGPESDLHADIHGAVVLNVTPILSKMKTDEPVFLSITRSRDETNTARTMVMSGISPLYSFSPKAEEAKQSEPILPAKEKCSYCANEAVLVGIPGFKICYSCAQIELARRVIVEPPIQQGT